jgi:hypothetical protein
MHRPFKYNIGDRLERWYHNDDGSEELIFFTVKEHNYITTIWKSKRGGKNKVIKQYVLTQDDGETHYFNSILVDQADYYGRSNCGWRRVGK